MPDCPTCGRPFDTRRGLGVHHSATHGELLPNRECTNCGSEFHSEHEKKYCSDECRDTAVTFAGKENPNYRGGMETTECDICDTQFEFYPSAKSGRFCATCVENKQWRHEPDIRGKRNPRWSGGERELECYECGTTFTRYRGNESDRDFCSRQCHHEWLSQAFAGEGHPNWKGGSQPNYGRGWRRVRKRALERDDYSCVVCGTTKEDLGRNPDVHHVVPVRAFVEHPALTERDAHSLENVVSLCIDCHRKAEFGRISRRRLQAIASPST